MNKIINFVIIIHYKYLYEFAIYYYNIILYIHNMKHILIVYLIIFYLIYL